MIKYKYFISTLVLLGFFTLKGQNAHAAISYDTTKQSYRWQDTNLTTTTSPAGGTNFAGPMPAKAVHMTEIHEAIDDAAQQCGNLTIWNPNDLYTLNTIQAGSRIRLNHLTTLKSGINTLYRLKGRTEPYLAQDISSGVSSASQPATRIAATDIVRMRANLDSMANFCISGSVPVCGNGGLPESGEQCDDGNITNGDGCSSTCQNESTCTIQVISSYMICKALSDPGNSCGAIPLGSACTLPGPSCQMSSTENEFNLPGGPCDGMGSGGWWSGYVQDIGCACGVTSVCGDGATTGAEQCDDSNTTNGDGCSSICDIESAAPTCSDGIQNQGEAYIDCGGPCAACTCWPDGYVFDMGGLPRLDPIADAGASQCCVGVALCYGNSTMCECGNGGTYLGNCTDGVQNNSETAVDCGGTCPACGYACGDGVCNTCGSDGNGCETCGSCPWDCCPGTCGDGVCNGGEMCGSCPADCGACPSVPVCGDGTCDAGEDCSTCADCACGTGSSCQAGLCVPDTVIPSSWCGDGSCDSGELCGTCAADCGCAGGEICSEGAACIACFPSGQICGLSGMSGNGDACNGCCSGSAHPDSGLGDANLAICD